MTNPARATRAVIHLENLLHNIRILRQSLSSTTKICMAVKADAYGHGAVEVSQVAVDEGVESLGVATVSEGRELRQAGIAVPLLLLSLPVPEEIPDVIAHRMQPLMPGLDFLMRLETEAERQGQTVMAHLKIDTGMGRIGCRSEEALSIAEAVDRSPHVRLAGVCTHLPVSDQDRSSVTERQVKVFRDVTDGIKAKGIDPGIRHAANSGAIVSYPPSHFDMVRPGILLYGYYPSRDQERILAVKPVMELLTKVVFLKRVPAGTRLSYGLTYQTQQESMIATLAVGYADGYSRLLSNRGEVVIRNHRYPLAGRICMDQCLVDLGPDASVKIYDDVILFGPDPGCPDAEDLAALMNTIPYEVTSLIGKRVPRIYAPSAVPVRVDFETTSPQGISDKK